MKVCNACTLSLTSRRGLAAEAEGEDETGAVEAVEK